MRIWLPESRELRLQSTHWLSVRRKAFRLRHSRLHFKLFAVFGVLLADTLANASKHSMSPREAFYRLSTGVLFENQSQCDEVLQDIYAMFRVPRESFGIVANSRGWLFGALRVGGRVLGGCGESIQKGILQRSLSLTHEAKCIIVVEKMALLQRLAQTPALMKSAVWLTACGYPDILTRKVLNTLSKNTKLQVFGLFDFDPHGLDIFFCYKMSTAQSVEAYHYACTKMHFLGLDADDLNWKYLDKAKAFSPLNKHDTSKIKSLETHFAKQISADARIRKSVDFWKAHQKKCELENFQVAGGCFKKKGFADCMDYFIQHKIHKILRELAGVRERIQSRAPFSQP